MRYGKESRSRHKYAKIMQITFKHKSRVIIIGKVHDSGKLSKRQLYTRQILG